MGPKKYFKRLIAEGLQRVLLLVAEDGEQYLATEYVAYKMDCDKPPALFVDETKNLQPGIYDVPSLNPVDPQSVRQNVAYFQRAATMPEGILLRPTEISQRTFVGIEKKRYDIFYACVPMEDGTLENRMTVVDHQFVKLFGRGMSYDIIGYPAVRVWGADDSGEAYIAGYFALALCDSREEYRELFKMPVLTSSDVVRYVKGVRPKRDEAAR